MTEPTPGKRRLKRFVIASEMWWYAATGAIFLLTASALVWQAPSVSNLTIAVLQLITGFTATVAAAISAIKANDTDD